MAGENVAEMAWFRLEALPDAAEWHTAAGPST
jgi:hypothetical protein